MLRRCAICAAVGKDGDPGWIRASIVLRDLETGKETVRVGEDLCPVHAVEATKAISQEVQNGNGQG